MIPSRNIRKQQNNKKGQKTENIRKNNRWFYYILEPADICSEQMSSLVISTGILLEV